MDVVTQLREALLPSRLAWGDVVEAEYDRYCHDCQCGDICRAATIEDVRLQVDSAAFERLVLRALPDLELSVLDRYALSRLLRALRVFDPDLWEVETEQGYYGDELAGISFCGHDRLLDALIRFAGLDSYDRVRFALELEYGHVLPSLRCAAFRVVSVPTAALVLPALPHAAAVAELGGHAEFRPDLPVALVTGMLPGPFRVVDGYHRTTSARSLGLDTVEVVLAVS